MGLVVRTDYVDGADITAAGQNTNENAIVNEVNGNLSDVNVATAAAIQGSKVASKPNGIATLQINAKAVTSVELANDAAVDASRAVDSDHIKNLAVRLRAVKRTTYTNAAIINIGLATITGAPNYFPTTVVHDTGLPIATTLPIAFYLITATVRISMRMEATGTTWKIIFMNNDTAFTVAIAAGDLKVVYLD